MVPRAPFAGALIRALGETRDARVAVSVAVVNRRIMVITSPCKDGGVNNITQCASARKTRMC